MTDDTTPMMLADALAESLRRHRPPDDTTPAEAATGYVVDVGRGDLTPREADAIYAKGKAEGAPAERERIRQLADQHKPTFWDPTANEGRGGWRFFADLLDGRG